MEIRHRLIWLFISFLLSSPPPPHRIIYFEENAHFRAGLETRVRAASPPEALVVVNLGDSATPLSEMAVLVNAGWYLDIFLFFFYGLPRLISHPISP